MTVGDAIVKYVDAIVNTVKSNTNGVAFFVNQCVIMLMLFEVVHWSEAQMFGFLAAVNAGLAVIVGKTTMATTKVDQRVEERIAHRELVGTAGTDVGMNAPPMSGSAPIKARTEEGK